MANFLEDKIGFSIIFAATENNVIGINNSIPWKLSNDMKRFKNITEDHTVIMGRKTFESLKNKPLKNRRNIVISKNSLNIENVEFCKSIEEAINKSNHKNEEVFIIGGSNIYNQFLDKCSRIYMTLVKSNIEGDSFFEILDLTKNWQEIYKESHKKDIKNEYDSDFIIYERK